MAVTGHNVDHTNVPYRASDSAATSGFGYTADSANTLWLPIWSGEVIHAYDEYNKFESMVTSKTISSGTEMIFPITGTVDLKAAWNSGEELIGGTDQTTTSFKVKLDARPMAAHFELDNIDLMLTQWEYRAELARQAGLTLANTRDKQIYAFLVRAAAETKLTNDPRSSLSYHEGFYGGASGEYPDFGNTSPSSAANRTLGALRYLQDLENFMVHLQEQNQATEGVYSVVSPQAFQDIRALGVARAAGDVINAQPMFGGVAEAGGLGAGFKQGMYGQEDTLEYMGVTICKSNHRLTADLGGTTTIGEARYNLDYQLKENAGDTGGGGTAHEIKAVTFQSGAVAALKLQGLKVDTVDDVRRNTVFTVASMMAGTGVLKPECATVHSDMGELTDGNNTDGRAGLQKALGMTAEYHPA
tara:strand:- start:9750 stop:10994 length:1245 start_codon:yes stop_codon:yes gene_type:complete